MAKRRKRVARKGGRRVVRRRRTSAARRRRRSGGNISLRRVRGAVYRRNPPLVKQLVQGAKDSVAVLGGGAATRFIAQFVPINQAGFVGAAVQLGAALVAGMAARQFLSADTARMVVAGGMQVPIKSLITSVVPQAGAFLGDMDAYLGGMGSYPELGAGPDADDAVYADSLSSYPSYE